MKNIDVNEYECMLRTFLQVWRQVILSDVIQYYFYLCMYEI